MSESDRPPRVKARITFDIPGAEPSPAGSAMPAALGAPTPSAAPIPSAAPSLATASPPALPPAAASPAGNARTQPSLLAPAGAAAGPTLGPLPRIPLRPIPLDTPIPRTLLALHQGVGEQLHVGAQLYVSFAGDVVADLGLGLASPGVEMTPETIMPWRSAGKPIAAVAIAMLWQKGLLDLDDPVAIHLPDFAQSNKTRITLRQLLTHTSGFRRFVPWDSTDWTSIVQRLCAAPADAQWDLGREAGYDIDSSWIILAEIVRRLDGRPFEQFARDEIFSALGMDDCWICMSSQFYEVYGERMGVLYNTEQEGSPVLIPGQGVKSAGVCRPGSSARGPARQLARFYEMLLRRGRLANTERSLLAPQTVEAITARHRAGLFDQAFGAVLDWGLGFGVNSVQYGDNIPYGFGPYASPRTFGHGGRQLATAFVDPDCALVVVLIFNGTPGEARHDARLRQVLAGLYTDLGLGA